MSAGAAALLWGLRAFCWPLTVPSNANVCTGACLGGIGGGQALRYFIAVYDHGSTTKAAEALFLAQPSISRQIRRLEGQLGLRLFEHVAADCE
ncbi:LysR family transcriptional regulator [Kitasatospora herbaricolor]|uniref:LysR family transcriptional regulator n=1 Tax=Kitasatospora herbaricolor TaxID=68217 RepID=A0ABZ1W2K5_9ACTN|nr:LysR family transcriptional regulator [Kitasatospora herbaricolor]